MSTAFISDEIQLLRVSAAQQACTLAGITLLLFETFQTADLELEYLWRRGRVRMILLFVAIRHILLANLVLYAITLAFPSPASCTVLGLIASILDVIPYIGWAIFLGWRAYALSSRNQLVALLVFIGSVSFASPSMIQIIGTTRGYTATMPPGCSVYWRWGGGRTVAAYLVDVSRPVNILAEATVLVLTCRATYRTWLSRRRATLLSNVLYENGIICFSSATILHIVTHILTLLPPTQNLAGDTVTVFRDVVITVLLSRFILELSKVNSQASDENQGASVTKGILSTEWTGNPSSVPSQWTLDDEYNGRGFGKETDTCEPTGAGYEA